MDFPHNNPNPNPNPNNHLGYFCENPDPMSAAEFQWSDYLMFDEGFEVGYPSQSLASSDQAVSGSIDSSGATSRNGSIKCKSGVKKNNSETVNKVAFRTKSELEVLDDGFKWRKYGKKSVKSSPNPRNYYKCSSGNCSVKKRVERDRNDSRYVITTYEGVHNHESPCALYYNSNQVPLNNMLPNDGSWTMQASSSHSSSTNS